MKVFSVFVSGLVLATASPQLHREQRGLLDDMWGDLRSGLGQISHHATRDIARIGQDVQPAMRQAESALNMALSQMVKNNPLLERFGLNTDRIGGSFTPVLSQANHETGAIDVAEEDTSAPIDPFAAFGGLGGLLSQSSQYFDPFSMFGMSRRSWWDGPNVCVDRKVLDEGTSEEEDSEQQQGPILMMDMTMTSCQDGPTFHKCTTRANTNGKRKTVTVRHECCYGHTRESGELGCTGMAMKSLEETVKDVGAEEFLELLDAVDMRGWLEDNITVFVPSDEAIEDFKHDLEQLNSIDMEGAGGYSVDDGLTSRRKKRQEQVTIVETPSLESVLRGHMVDGFVPTSELHDEDVLATMDGEGSKLRITMYNRPAGPVIMANCAKVTSSDHFATNGVAHKVDRVLLPARQTLAEIISSDSQFKRLSIALEDAGMMAELAKAEGQFTFFAPTDAAFDRLDEATKAKINGGTGCSADILSNHLLHNVICSGVVEGKAKTVNALKKYLILDRDEQDVLTVEGVTIVMNDIVGINGIIHVVDEVLIPATARTVDQALEDEGATTLAELFRESGLDLEALSNVTVFAPSEKVLNEMPAELMADIRSDKEKLSNFLLYHVAKPKTCKCDFEDNKVYPSALEGTVPLRMNKYGSMPLNLFEAPKQIVTVQCGKLTNLDDEACGAMIHTVDKVLLPPSGNTISILKDYEERYSKFLELIIFAELENELSLEGPFTVLAPDNDAFEHLDAELTEKIFEDKDAAIEVVYKHIIRGDHICCSGIPRHMPFLDLSGRRTAGGDVIALRRSRGGHIYADRAELTMCDLIAENGVVHQLDRVLIPDSLETAEQQVEEEKRRRSSSAWAILDMFNKKK